MLVDKSRGERMLGEKNRGERMPVDKM